MAIRFRCHTCSGLMSISSRKAGAMVECPTCGNQTLVPMEDSFEIPSPALPHPVSPQPASPQPAARLPVAAAPAPVAVSSPPDIEFQSVVPEQLDLDDSSKSPSKVDLATLDYDVPDQFDANSLSALAGEGAHEGDQEGANEETREEQEDVPPLRLRRRSSADDEMDLTPMVDVTFQLLIFFMVTASFALQKSIEVPTPDPDKKGAAQQLQILENLEGTSIRVQIDAANAILIDDEPLGDPSRLTESLKDKMRKEQKTELLITAHPQALHRTVIAVIDAANSAGMQKIRMVSRQGKSDS